MCVCVCVRIQVKAVRLNEVRRIGDQSVCLSAGPLTLAFWPGRTKKPSSARFHSCLAVPPLYTHTQTSAEMDNEECSGVDPLGVHFVQLARPSDGSCGFHLTRSKWDPYPWVSGVDEGSPAASAGLRAGDCLLETNGLDIVGLRVAEVATRVLASTEQISLLVWRPGTDPGCSTDSLCCGPMPLSLQKLTSCVSAIVAALECPVCLDTIPPPAHQCVNGHLLCVRCRVHTDKCPICRVPFSRGRSLLADQVYNALHETFEEKSSFNKDESTTTTTRSRPRTLRERLFGPRAKSTDPSSTRTKSALSPPQLLVHSPTNKLLTRLIGKASSVDNLSQNGKHDRNRIESPNTFTADLRAKSLSTGEICGPAAAALSRPDSLLSLNNNQRAASYHGSSDSLSHPPEDLFHCPCSITCQVLMSRESVLDHCRGSAHPGPLIQYPRSSVDLHLPLPYDGRPLISITAFGHQFLFKEYTNENGDISVWIWLIGNCDEAKDFQFQMILSSNQKIFNAPVYALNSISFLEAIRCKQTLLIKSDSCVTSSPLNIKIQVIKS